MIIKKKNCRYNPFLMAFVCFALIIFLILGVLFLFMMHEQNNQSNNRYYQDKADTMVNDFATQYNNLVALSQKFSINDSYMYSSVFKEKYNEYILLEDFHRYRDFSFMTENMFLYYVGCNNIFRSAGDETFFHVYFSELSQQGLLTIRDSLNNPGSEPQLLPIDSKLYILIPFKADYGIAAQKATLGCALDYGTIESRLELVSGQIVGKIALYYHDQLVYCNSPSSFDEDAKGIISASCSNGSFTLHYIPDHHILLSVINLLQMLLILIVLLMTVGLAFLFANKVYQPLHDISQKYYNSLSESSAGQYNNIYEEIDGILDTTLRSKLNDAAQLEQRQEQLKQHILKSLLNGAYVQDAESSLKKLNIELPGPFYYVISIAFLSDVDPDFGETIQQEMKKAASLGEHDYVFPIIEYQKKELWVICSINDRENEVELTENIQDILTAYNCTFKIGTGKVHKGLNKLPASYLESMDNLHEHNNLEHSEDNDQNFENLQWLSNSLSTGNEQIALQHLEKYVQTIRESPNSMLIQLYIFSEFIGELARVSRSNGVELSKQTISLILSARNIDSFAESARFAITEYCKQFQSLSLEKANNKAQKVCEYVQAHFTDYDLSIDSIASNVGIPTTDVRNAILTITGQKYTDYVTSLRIDYAKKLMASEKLSVAEICEAVGYSSVSYFIRLFKEATGLTPAKYMKNISSFSFSNDADTH